MTRSPERQFSPEETKGPERERAPESLESTESKAAALAAEGRELLAEGETGLLAAAESSGLEAQEIEEAKKETGVEKEIEEIAREVKELEEKTAMALEQVEAVGTEEVPQLDEVTGVSHDYANEFAWAHASTDDLSPEEAEEEYDYLLQKKAKQNDGTVIRKYEDVYQGTKYAGVVNEKNAVRIARINTIAEEVNRAFKEGTLTRDELKNRTKEVAQIIYEAKKPAEYD